MKPAHKAPDQIWRDYLIAQAKLDQHLQSVPTAVIRNRIKRMKVTVTKVRS